jgi:hypothetical protein
LYERQVAEVVRGCLARLDVHRLPSSLHLYVALGDMLAAQVT